MAAVASHQYDAGPSAAGPSSSSGPYGQAYGYGQNHSVMEDVSDEGDEDDDDDDESEHDFESEVDPEQQRFYAQQQQQALYYQQHQQQNGGMGLGGGGSGSGRPGSMNGGRSKGQNGSGSGSDAGGEEEDVYSDDEGSSVASIPDENIDAGLTFALHTFVATVEGQASVVKGDSLLLLDDTNAYWWLVRVLKTEDVGYIPAENIETPYERLARLNKHRNVDLAHPTMLEKAEGEAQGRQRMKPGLSAPLNGGGVGNKSAKRRASEEAGEGPRRVIFAPPTYVEPSIRTWSSDEESGEDDGEEGEESGDEEDGEEGGMEGKDQGARGEQSGKMVQMADMEPDDGVEWADGAGQEEQRRAAERRQQFDTAGQSQAEPTKSVVQPKSNNPFGQQRAEQSRQSSGLDPAQAGGETRRITVTPAVAQETQSNGVLLPSAVMANASANANGVTNVNGQRTVSGQSSHSMASTTSTGSLRDREDDVGTSPDDKRSRKMRKSASQDSLTGSDKGDKKEKKRSMLGGLFSRKSKDKKGIPSSDPRNSEDSIVSGAMDGSPSSMTRRSEENVVVVRAPTPAETRDSQGQQLSPQSQGPGGTSHSLRLQQKDQATMQAYSSKYLKTSPTSDVRTPTASEAAAAVAQSAAAMRLAATMSGATNRPSSIIVSPNPAAPLLNVMRIFAGEHIKSDVSFKTVLLNDTTTSVDLIKQVIQRFRIHPSSAAAEKGFYLTIKDVNGEEMELGPTEKPLTAFLDAVQRCAEEDGEKQARAITPTVKRSSISSISSVMSLSSHPAIAKLGMNDFSDDSAVKIYLNRRRPGSHLGGGIRGEQGSEMGSYSSQLSTVLESGGTGGGGSGSRQSGVWSNDGSQPDFQTGSPEIPQYQQQQMSMRYNPSLTINTKGEASPERFSSPSSRFTIQVLVHPVDLPDGSVFDPLNDAIISRQVLRDRLAAGHPSQGSRDLPQDKRRRLFLLPRNATVVEAIEQGLDRFGIQEGVVDGGDDVEERTGKRTGNKVRYSLISISKGRERALPPSSKILDAYFVLPTLKPVERTTMEQRRRSREWSYNLGTPADILPTDPVFVLRRSGNRHPARSGPDPTRAILQQQQQQSMHSPTHSPDLSTSSRNGAMSPQEIIAAQRAASRANQIALISAHENKSEGIDVVYPSRGTLRSSRLLEPTGDEVVRYSFIDDDGETYDISELLEEEWGDEDAQDSPVVFQGSNASTLRPPGMNRQPTDQSVYVTAPSTPEPGVARSLSSAGGATMLQRRGSGSTDILKGVVERSAGKPEGKLEEKIAKVIDKVKSSGRVAGTADGGSQPQMGWSNPTAPVVSSSRARHVPEPSRPLSRVISPFAEGQSSGSPSSVNSRSNSRAAGSSALASTAESVNRIISRHRQQPSIASIMSDISTPVNQDHSDDGSSHTPATATSSASHPTPPLGTAIFVRAVSSTPSPTPRVPVKYTDDFGMKTLMGLVEARAREMRPKANVRVKASNKPNLDTRSSAESGESRISTGSTMGEEEGDEAYRLLWGEKIGKEELERMNPEIRACLGAVQSKLDAWDAELDGMLAKLGGINV